MKKCENCGKELEVEGKKFCNEECYYQWKTGKRIGGGPRHNKNRKP